MKNKIQNKIQIQTENVLSKNKNRLQQFVVLLLVMILLLTGCSGGNYSSTPTIDGKSLEDSSRALDELNVQKVVTTQAEKYKKHYQNGLYYEDLSKVNKELSEKYKQALRKEWDEYMKKNIPLLADMSYALQTEIEYVKADAKAYAEGKKTAEEIVTNPNSIMKMKIRLFMFEDFRKNWDYELASDKMQSELVEEYFNKKYIEQGVGYFDFVMKEYYPSVLNKYSIEEIEKNLDIMDLLDEEKTTTEQAMFKTHFADDFENHKIFIRRGLIDSERGKAYSKALGEKYNLEFYKDHEGWFRAKKYPEIHFDAIWISNEGDKEIIISDHFQTAMVQYLINKRLEKIIKEAGLEDRVVFLVTAESQTATEYSLARKPYDFGDGFDEEFFLKEGYAGYVDVTLIYLDDKANRKNNLKREELEKQDEEFLKKITESILKPLHQQIHFGFSKSTTYREGSLGDGSTEPHIYKYYVNDYDRKVIVDLFKRYPITEYERMPDKPGLGDVFSLQYITRAETPGFHYLDIFGEKGEHWNLGGYYMQEYEKNH